MVIIGAEKGNKALVYIKREWLMDISDSDNLIIETLDAEDIDSLNNNLDVTNIMRYVKHIKNCTLQNVF